MNPYIRGGRAIFRKLPDNKAECVIDFRDVSLLPSVLFFLNNAQHEGEQFVRESNDLLYLKLRQKDEEIERLKKLIL